MKIISGFCRCAAVLGSRYQLGTSSLANSALSASLSAVEFSCSRSRLSQAALNVVARAKLAPPTASQALDRIEMPDEVAEKLSEMLWAGAAFIVSDNEMSHETTDFARTDFVVLTGGRASAYRARTAPAYRGGRSLFDFFW